MAAKILEESRYSNRKRGAELAYNLLRMQNATDRQHREYHAGGDTAGNDSNDSHHNKNKNNDDIDIDIDIESDNDNDGGNINKTNSSSSSFLDTPVPATSTPSSFLSSNSTWEESHTLATPVSMAQYPLKEVSASQPRTVTFTAPEPLRPESLSNASSRSGPRSLRSLQPQLQYKQQQQQQQQQPQPRVKGRHSMGDTSRSPLNSPLRRKSAPGHKSTNAALGDESEYDDEPREVLKRPGTRDQAQKPSLPPLSLSLAKYERTSRSSYESSLGIPDFWAPEGETSTSLWSTLSGSPAESSSQNQAAARNSLELPSYLGRRPDRDFVDVNSDDIPSPLPPKSDFRRSPRVSQRVSLDKSPPSNAKNSTTPTEPRAPSRSSASTHSSAHASVLSNRRRRSPPPPLRSSSPDDMDDRDKRYYDFTLKAIQEVMQQQQQHQSNENERPRQSSPAPSPRQVQFVRNMDEDERRNSGSSCHSCAKSNHQSQNLEENSNLSVRGRQSTETSSSPLRQRFNMRSLSPIKKKGGRATRASGDGYENGLQAVESRTTTPNSSWAKKDKRGSGESRKSRAEKSRERKESDANKDSTFLKNWGTKIKKNMADLTTGDTRKQQQQNSKNSNPFQSRLAPAISSVPISLDPPAQAKLYSELELMLCVSANQFLINQHKARRISVESFSKTLNDWTAKSRANVPQFQFDQVTQCELITANRRTARFHGECARSAIELSSSLRAWACLADEMSVRTFCATDSAVRKHLHDALKILEMLGAPSMTFLAFQELQVNSLALMKREQERRLSETETEMPMPLDFFENRLSIDNAEPSGF